MTRKILYITGTRADYGLMRSVLRRIHEHPDLSLDIVVTGMHLMDEFGHTVDEIQKDGFPYDIVEVIFSDDTKAAMATFIGKLIEKITSYVCALKPDIILVLGDRGEMLAGAIVGSYLSIPVAHIHGGEVTSTVDDITRHAITKLSHIHFPATLKSAERIIMMGEDPLSIYVVGAPGLEQILDGTITDRETLLKKYDLNPEEPIILVIQHPVTMEYVDAADQMYLTLEAVKVFSYQTVVIYPNADAGGINMIRAIRDFGNSFYIRTFASLPHSDYLGLMNVASVLVGNSSSGIIEAPSFYLPVVNIGTRQKGRERGKNVIDVPYDKEAIIQAIKKSLFDDVYRKTIQNGVNPYGDGTAGKKIADLLVSVPLTGELLQKRMKY